MPDILDIKSADVLPAGFLINKLILKVVDKIKRLS